MDTPSERNERTFDLDLPAIVQGTDTGDREFIEKTEIASMSAQEAFLRLRARVEPGAKLRLSLHIPRTFFLEKPLDLNLTGTVDNPSVESNKDQSGAFVRVQLDPSFQIIPASD